MFKVLITDRFAVPALERLREVAEVVQITPSDIHNFDTSSFDAMLIRSRTVVDAKLLKKSLKLKLIVTCTSGFDHIDLETCQKNSITACYTPEANAQSAAELTWALVMACSRKIISANKMTQTGEWDRNPLVGHELYKKTLGIIGLGRVGQRVARIAKAFAMNVLANDPYVDEFAFEKTGAHRCGWEEVLRSSDILTLHVPLTKETKGFINHSTLDCFHHGAILINTSRGQVMQEQAVTEYLKAGKISALGLDVFEKEPLPKTSALISLPNVVLTPHIGANTVEAFERGSQAAVDKVLAFLQGRPVEDNLCQQ
jgi:D-3-phosphoglycerate dehydrogenase / 2-oxoglutarate reductase